MNKSKAIIEENRRASDSARITPCPDLRFSGPIKDLDVRRLASEASRTETGNDQ
jgi:hypothetical protein